MIPLRQEILLLPPHTSYFAYQQRPTLLMNAMARQGWDVHWVRPERMIPRPDEHKEENVIFWGAEEEDIPLSMDNILKWIISPAFRPGTGNVHPGGLWLFDYLDDFPQTRGSSEAVMKDVDVVFCSSEVLLERAKRIKGEDVHILHNGVDYHLYENDTEDPEKIYKGIPRPRIGYMGALAYWLDWDLITTVAKAHPDWSIVLIGFL